MHQSPLVSGSPEIVKSKESPNIQGYGAAPNPRQAILLGPLGASRDLSIWDAVIAEIPERGRSTRDTPSPNTLSLEATQGLEKGGL